MDPIKKRKQELRDERLTEFAPPSIYSSSKTSASELTGLSTKRPKTDTEDSADTVHGSASLSTSTFNMSGASQNTATTVPGPPFHPAGSYFYPPGPYPPPPLFNVPPPPPPGMSFAPPPPGGPYFMPSPPLGMRMPYCYRTPPSDVQSHPQQVSPPPPPPGLPPNSSN